MSYRDECEALEVDLSTPYQVKNSPNFKYGSNAFPEMSENDFRDRLGLALMGVLLAFGAVGLIVMWSTGGVIGQ